MKNSIIILIICSRITCFNLYAQKNPLKFHSINSIGCAFGQSGTSAILQTVNGFSYKSWFSGLGFGADYYHYKTYPLFIDIRKYAGIHYRLFAYADVGDGLAGKNGPSKKMDNLSNKFYNGIYTDIGMGYTWPVNNKARLSFTAGYSYKRVKNRVGIITECLVGPCPVYYDDYKYGDGRLVIKG